MPYALGAGQASQAVANGPKQLALTPGEDPRSAAVAPRDTSPGLGPVVDNPPGPLVRRSKPKTTADIPARQRRLPIGVLKALGRAVAEEAKEERTWRTRRPTCCSQYSFRRRSQR